MTKLPLHTTDLSNKNYTALVALFPNAVTETIDENGETVRAIDADVLAQEINTHVVSGKEERYQFTWPDKKKSVLLANSPIAATLRPCRDESMDFDNTENLYIEGDNLDVLKLLRETYLNRIKMIYIDPPYNTGNDFIYEDDFAEDTREFLARDYQYDDDGNRMVRNLDSNGRFHTDWLNMICPRLKIARDLLTDDGVIFISIDDNEVETLGKVCNEVFGENNFINIVTVKTKIGGVSGSSEGKSLKDTTEFIWVYAKNKNELEFYPVYIKTKLFDRIKNYEIEGKSWKYTSIITKLEDKILIKESKNRGVRYYGYKTLETMSISSYAETMGLSEEEVYNKYTDKIFQTTNAQSSVRQTVMKEMDGKNYPMIGCEYVPIKGKNEGRTIEVLYKGEQRRMVMFLSDAVEKIDGIYYYLDKITSLWDDIDYNNLTKEGDIEFSNGKKPIKLLQRMFCLSTNKESIILDFFSGSASTAHAAMKLNAEDGGKRKFIMVQLPEVCAEEREAAKAGYKNICEIGKERIRRAGRKIVDESPLDRAELDIGFRVLKLDSSNMKDVYYTPQDTVSEIGSLQIDLDGFTDNIKSDRTAEDLLFQVMLDLGILLSSKIEKREIDGKTVFSVGDNYLIACFDRVTDEIVTEIAKAKPYYAIFRDSSFYNDATLVNFEQIFRTYSPTTVRKVL